MDMLQYKILNLAHNLFAVWQAWSEGTTACVLRWFLLQQCTW